MATPEEVGKRIESARLARGLGVKNAAEAAGVARDTWYRIEKGKPGQDSKRHLALALLGLDSDGLPLDGPTPLTPAQEVDARLANLDRQVDALWRRIEQLEGHRSDSEEGDAGRSGLVTPLRPRTPPQPATGPEPGLALPADQTPGEPSQYEQVTRDQDQAGEENQDLDQPGEQPS